ncbi:MAG TPA: hypothetical protein VNO24_02455 [Blastocatellia bacterium]|nr:hypothetical protein [Blastocatellia bacterium]
MRFSNGIILIDGSGATIRAAAHFISFFLINAITLNAQIAPPGNAARSEERVIAQQADRILPLLAALADQASLSADLTFAVRAQSQAATWLWTYDREQARAIYRRAFQSLVCNDNATPKAASVHRPSRLALTAIAKQHLLVELLREIARRDAGLAEDLARGYTAPVAGADAGCACTASSGNRENDSASAFFSSSTARTQREVERRDLLVGVALQIVERDPTRAMALAQLSLASGVSPNFSELLLSLRAVDAELADRLFASAVGGLERSRDVDLDSLHTLGAFLVSATDPIAGESVSRGVVVRFLNCALVQLSRLGQMSAGWRSDGPANQGIADEHEAVIYFISRQLGDLFARYMPDRLGQFKRKIAELSATNTTDRAIVSAPTYSSNLKEIVREAPAASMAADRDILYARAAFAWLAEGEVSRAQAAAAEVAAAAIRDRIMIQVARRYSSSGRLDDAVAATGRIRDAVVRANLLMSFAGALASKDGTRATDLLDEAVGCALAAPPSMTRALALIGTARSFTAFDARRGFKVMQTAVTAINEALAQRDASEPAHSNPGAVGEYEASELYGSSFEVTFAALGRADFERAWSLAQQLAARDISVLAQLAACRGGLDRP